MFTLSENYNWLKTFGTLSIGGGIGGLLGTVICLGFKTYLEGIGFHVVVGLCVAIGAGVQQMFQRAAVFLLFFEKLFELGMLMKIGIIKKGTYRKIVDELVRRKFLSK